MDCVGFTLIIDDIVLPDGTTFMQQLGGGGAQTLFGFQLISQVCLGCVAKLGLAAGVGTDLPAPHKDWLRGIGVDVSGLIEGQLPTPRAWQLFEEDGTRTQVWRVSDCPELYQQLRPTFEQLPPHFQASTANYHLGVHASHPPMKLLRALADAAHARGGLLSVETYTCCDSPPPEQELRELLGVVDIFSPNLDEAVSIVGDLGTPQQLVQRLVQLGAHTVALRMGEQGVLVASRRQEQDGQVMCCQVPAVPDTRVVDVTGCGNAFCGGFLAGLHAGLGVEQSAVWGCVAGSIMAEAQGVPTCDVASLLPVAHQKHQQLLRVMGSSSSSTSASGSSTRSSSTNTTTAAAVMRCRQARSIRPHQGNRPLLPRGMWGGGGVRRSMVPHVWNRRLLGVVYHK